MSNIDETSFEDAKAQIDRCHSLFVDSIGEIGELTLEVVVTEAKLQPVITTPRSDSPIAPLEVGCRPNKRDSTCWSFRIVFDSRHMVLYSVLNESYGRYPELPEEFSGRHFRTFSRSHLLDFTNKTTHACDEYPGCLLHFQIVCNNHVIDVISTSVPAITVIPSVAQRLIDLGGSNPGMEDIPRRRPPWVE